MLLADIDPQDLYGAVTANVNFAGSATALVVHPARTARLFGAPGSKKEERRPGTMGEREARRVEGELAGHVYGGPLRTATSCSAGIGWFTTSRLVRFLLSLSSLCPRIRMESNGNTLS